MCTALGGDLASIPSYTRLRQYKALIVSMMDDGKVPASVTHFWVGMRKRFFLTYDGQYNIGLLMIHTSLILMLFLLLFIFSTDLVQH